MFEYFPLIVPNFYLNMNHKNEKQKITLSGTSSKESPMEKTYQQKQNRYINTQIHDRSFIWFGTDTSIKSERIKLALWATPLPIVEGCGHASGLSVLLNKLVSVLN